MVSIIIPVYNTGPYLAQCLQSVKEQTFRDIEIVIVNDGSTDNSHIIVNQFVKENPELTIQYIMQENRGISAARNTGIDAAHGDWLMFLDSDDFIEPYTVEDLLIVGNRTGASIVKGYHCRGEHCAKKGKIPDARVYTGNEQLDLLFSLKGDDHTNIVAVWGAIYRQELFASIRFPAGRVYEDESIIHRLLDKSHCLAWIDYPYYHYINRGGSIVNTPSLRNLHDKMSAFEDRIRYLAEKKPQYVKQAALVYYSYCVDCMISFCRGEYLLTQKQECWAIIDEMIENRCLFYTWLPWHQKLCVVLLMTRADAVLRFLARHEFAPGRRLLSRLRGK